MKKKLLSLFLMAISLVAFKAQAQSYCTTGLYSSGTSFGDEITIFTVGSFTKNSTGQGGGSAGYANFTSDTIMLNQSLAYPLSITYGPTYSQGSAVWIDYNDDGDFNDAGEHLYSTPDWALSHTGTLIISGTADTGYHRLRVRCNYNGTVAANQSCASFTYGEVEDYTVYIGPPPPCPPPLYLAASSITSSTATISWQSTNNVFKVEYGPAGFTQGTGDTTSSTSTSVGLTGLMANTDYDVYVQSDCSGSGNGLSMWGGPLSFTTLCTSVSVYPNNENFNDTARWKPEIGFNPYPSVIDNCWDRSPVQSSYGQYGWVVGNGPSYGFNTGPNSDRSGSGQYVYVNSAGSSLGDSSFLNLPLFDLSTLTSPLFTFYTHMYGGTTGTLLLQVSSTGATWTTVYTLSGQKQDSANANWTEQLVDLTTYKSSTTYLRFVAISAGGNGDMAIDDVSMAEAPPCPKPTAFSIGSITSSTATLSFISNGVAFPIEYGPAGYIQGTGATDTATGTGHIISGLASNTAYDLYIQNNCTGSGNGLSAWAGPYTFRTLCAPFAEGYMQNFDGIVDGFKEPCWDDLSYGQSHSVNALAPPVWSQISPASSPHVYYWYNSGASWSYIMTPEFVGLDGDSTQIRFDMTHNYWNSTANIEVFVGTMSDKGDTGSIAWHDTISPAQYTWTEFTILMDNVPTGHKFVVFGRDNSYTFSEVDIDDFNFEGIPQCLPPTSGSAQAISSTSISVTWMGPGTSYDVEYGVQGFTQGTGSIDTNVTSPYTISNLTSNTCYDVYVRTNCGSGSTSPWFGPITVCTPCNAQSMPYSEDFATWPPNCFIFDNTSSWDWDHDANGHARARFWSFNGGTAFMTSGPVNITQKPRVKFKWAHQYQSFYPNDRLVFMARVLGSPTWDTLIDLSGSTFDSPNSGTTTPPALSDFIEEQFNLDSATYVGNVAEFQFAATSGYGPHLFVDDFLVEAQPICTEPDQVTVTGITGYSAVLNWNASVGSQFEIEYGPQGFQPGTGTAIVDTTTSSPYTFTGLTPVTCYDVYIRTLCGSNGNSVWTGPISFCTAVSCPAPTNPMLVSAGQSSASFSWTTGSASSWNYVNVAQGFGPGSGTIVFNATNPQTVTGLSAGTAYSFFVRDSCGPGDVSAWAGPVDYTTPLCDTSQQCDYTIYMHDSFGDGWNGFEVGIVVNGVTFNTLGNDFTSGFEDTTFFSACNGFVTAANILAAGSYPTEVSFEIVSAFGDTVVVGSSFSSSSTGTTAGTWVPNCIPISCPVPDSLAATNVTANSADLSWSSTGNNFQVSYGMMPFAANNGTIVAATTNSYMLTSLMSNTQYGFYVREICQVGDTSIWNGPYSFATLCTTFNAPFFEDFETSTGSSGCWSQTYGIGTNDWSFGIGSSGGSVTTAFSGSLNAVHTSTSGTQSTYLISPVIDASSTSNPILAFAYAQEVWAGDQNSLTVYYRDSPSGSWNYLWADSTSVSAWKVDTVSVPSSSATLQIGFLATDNWGRAVVLDDVFLGDISGCPDPTNVSITGTTCTTVEITWNSDPGTTMSGILYDTAGFNPQMGGTMLMPATSPQTISGLTANTAYDFYVIDSCSAGVSNAIKVSGMTANGPQPIASFTASPNASTHPDTIQYNFSALASSNADSFWWDYGDGSPNDTDVFTIHDYTANGTYTVTLVVTNDCGSDTATQTIVIEGISIEETALSRSLNIFPNPTDGQFNVEFTVDGKQDITLRVMDALGRVMAIRELGIVTGPQALKLDLSGHASGIYLIQIDSRDGSITKRLTLRNR